MLDVEIRDQYGVDFLIRGSIQVMGTSARLNLDITDLKLEEITVSKKRYLKIHADVSIVSRIIENFHQDLTKYFDPTPHLQLHSPTKFLSHQAFLI